MKRMLEAIKAYMNQYDMLRPGDRVIAAVSGGADSVCMLSVLEQIARELPASVQVLHVHHGLRGPEADRDEAFVKQLCERLMLPFLSVHRDVKAYAAAHRLSVEEAGRMLRREALEQAAEDWDEEAGRKQGEIVRPARIAVAHHREDSAETVVFHLLRGSGLKGLSGICPVSGRIIRPLLDTGKQEILSWLEKEGLGWCEDSTNAATDYTRNFIRHRLLPSMKEGVNEQAEEHILQAARLFSMADQYLSRQAEQVWEQGGSLERPEGEDSSFFRARISLSVFQEQDEIIRLYVIRRMLDLVSPGWKNVSSRHFGEILRLADSQVGSRLSLPGGLTAQVGYGELELRRGEKSEAFAGFSMEQAEMSVFSLEKGVEIPKNQYTKWFDYDRIKGTLFLRGRQQGDYITLADGGRKTIARLMIDEKIPREQRDQIPLLAEGNHVLWVVGSRISEYYKITDQTKTVLQVRYHGGEHHGR